jgi:rhodanese-related sulfurtransferase
MATLMCSPPGEVVHRYPMNLRSRVFGASQSLEAIDVYEASRRQAAGALLIDVREPAEWQQGHAPEAKLVPLGSIVSHVSEIPRDAEVLLICRSGNRSGTAQRQLRQLGYERVCNVSGGMNVWASAGLPVAR